MLDRRTALALLMPIAALTLPAACSGEMDGVAEPDFHGEREGPNEIVVNALEPKSTVAQAVVSSVCATSLVKGLSVQLVEEIQCIRPKTLVRIDKTRGLSLGASTMPYLQTKVADGLIAAQKARGITMSINSTLRTLPQQYLLFRWYKTGRCNIGLAASPGTSNHESGTAIDINDSEGWRSSLRRARFSWLGPTDAVHYDFEGGGTVALPGLSVQAFQRLWNRNNPNDKVAEDGTFGAGTEARLAKSPVGGFPIGADCTKVVDGGGPPTQPIGEPEELPEGTPSTGDGGAGGSSTVEPSPQTEPQEPSGCRAARADGLSRGPGFGPWSALLAFMAMVARRKRPARV